MVLLDALYDTDGAVPISSPLKKVVDLRLDLASESPILIQSNENVDPFHLRSSREPELRVSDRTEIDFPSTTGPMLLNSLDDLPAVNFDSISTGPDHGNQLGQQLESSNAPRFDSLRLQNKDMEDSSQPLIIGSTRQPLPVKKLGSTAKVPRVILQEIEPRDPEPPNFTTGRRRLGLPLSLSGGCGKTTIMSCVDTGSNDNMITLEEAGRLGLTIISEATDVKDFFLPNGKTMRSLGKAMSPCSFPQGFASPDTLVAVFYVFQTLIEPMIIGMRFLELTETLSKHGDRLIQLEVPSSQPLRMLSIGTPRRNLHCRLAENIVFANTDSGSDADFVSGKYAKKHNLAFTPNNKVIMFADGTTATTSGVVRLPLSVGEPDTHDASKSSPNSIQHLSDFHVFDDGIHDVLIGHATIESLQIFTRFDAYLLPGLGALDDTSISIIRLLEKKIPTLKDIGNFFSRRRAAHDQGPLLPDEDEDQMANARDSMEIFTHSMPSPPVSQTLLRTDYFTNQSGAFVCTYTRCDAAPFETQGLLNSHANVHYSARPYFCPVRGCPRSKSGKGFKRKNELNRHGLIHASPGYVCPFCPDREHKYPRPDNLQSHVEVHHTDKDKDDPQLREVLAQRPDGPSGGRRR